jgi:peptide/nickel transport system permease protein
MAVLVFVGVYAIGNPIDIMISPDSDQAEMEAAIARLGLDKPLWEQFFIFVKNALQGDLGRSFVYSTDALGLILSKLPATLELAFLALLFAVFLGVPLGMIAGLCRSSASPSASSPWTASRTCCCRRSTSPSSRPPW